MCEVRIDFRLLRRNDGSSRYDLPGCVLTTVLRFLLSPLPCAASLPLLSPIQSSLTVPSAPSPHTRPHPLRPPPLSVSQLWLKEFWPAWRCRRCDRSCCAAATGIKALARVR